MCDIIKNEKENLTEKIKFNMDDAILKNGVYYVPEDVECIGAFSGESKYFENVVLPDSVRNIEREAFGYISKSTFFSSYNESISSQIDRKLPKNINLPKNYLKQNDGCYDVEMATHLLNGPWKEYATDDDYIYMLINVRKKSLIKICHECLSEKMPDVMDKIISAAEKGLSTEVLADFADISAENKEKISSDQMMKLYTIAKKSRAKKAMTIIEKYTSVTNNGDEKTDAEINPIEKLCYEKFNEQELDKALKTMKKLDAYCPLPRISDKDISDIYYKESEEKVSPFVIKCIIAPYILQLAQRPHKNGRCDAFECITESDELADKLDMKSFRKMIAEFPMCHESLSLKCRYGSEDCIREIITESNKRKKDKYDTFHIVLNEAIMLSDTREAMIFAEKNRILDNYAKHRGTTADILRNTKMVDFGLDKDGKCSFDLGSTVIEVSLNKDLTLSLYDVNAGKSVKSIPKRNADPAKYDSAKTAFDDMKKNIKKILKSRNEILFEKFLSGATFPSQVWNDTYNGNPVLHRISELIVWKQKTKTFIVTSDNKTLDCDGNDYLISGDRIGVAHPLNMKNDEIRKWQNYFVVNGLKQPFEQVWEPVIRPETIKKNRYSAFMIPYYRFVKQEKRGIFIEDEEFHNTINFDFVGCKVQVERVDFQRHHIDMNDRFRIKSLSFDKYTRGVNHIIAYLDRITVYDKIKKDDISISDMLSDFTLAQIIDFINIATENHSVNVLSMLLEYKNSHFPEFNPMSEFVL